MTQYAGYRDGDQMKASLEHEKKGNDNDSKNARDKWDQIRIVTGKGMNSDV